MDTRKEIPDRIKDLIAPHLESSGVELVEITYKREQAGMVLRLLVDTPEGIRLNECEALNAYVSDLLDKEDIIDEQYVIEVSSPGLDRPMKTDRDFGRSLGKMIEVTTYEAIDGRKTHEGALIGMDKEKIVIESQGGVSTVIPRKSIALARLKIEF